MQSNCRKQKNGRRWLQFSLKSLFIVCLIVAAFFGGRASMTRQLRQAHIEAEMQRAIAERNLATALSAVAQQQLQQAARDEVSPAVRAAQEAMRQNLAAQAAEDGAARASKEID